mmetsp:Transcript_5427/g.7852  ORF Transcript_5427/g.7852 Transcript_5427/m.7852 type:complete len:392 (-) Transcript_5427:1261-2436(-)|eukprot:CAMPEP_0194226464 /NCGR_PEP_ID=MMETSP0156-20130528/41897_1 /TAXON_ID=33649 /ORGANISM="Thalassionema nitzschioides, Strain L26-B" /LENGTH=391 /DNA_ID=CAMNT_0038958821 /DNA_START=96 /DNA_END=1271 /DNA_ORIENTATION=-
MATASTTEANILTESSTEIFSSRHLDYVHHVAFDSYGRRMATCSGDRFVRIWDYVLVKDNNKMRSNDGRDEQPSSGATPQNGLSWQLSTEFQAHRGSVTKVTWCHSEFGTLVATCSNSDVKIWEEQTPTHSHQYPSKKATWVVKAHLTEARRHVTALEFCPRTFGLQLATGSADGVCRMYEAVDLMNLSQWPLQASWTAVSTEGGGITCLSWCPSRFEPPTLALGSNTHVSLWRYHSALRQYVSLLQFPKHPGSVLDVSWAPNVGRRFHWIASCENGGALRVYQLSRGSFSSSDINDTANGGGAGDDANAGDTTLELKSTHVLPCREGSTWKCEWNVTGTVLATSGDGGVVQLWKCDTASGGWKCVSQIHGDCMEGGNASKMDDTNNIQMV